MGDNHHGHALVGQLPDQIQHLADHLRIQRRSRLVEQHHLRIHRQRADDRDALLLPAGQGGRIHMRLVLQADAFQEPQGRLPRLGLDPRLARVDRMERLLLAAKQIAQLDEPVPPLQPAKIAQAQIDRRQHDIVEHGFVVEQVEVLKHHAHLTAVNVDVRLPVGNILTVEDDGAARRIFHAIQAAEEGALAASGRPDDRDLLALPDRGRNPLQHVQLAIGLLQINDVYHFFSGSFPIA